MKKRFYPFGALSIFYGIIFLLILMSLGHKVVGLITKNENLIYTRKGSNIYIDMLICIAGLAVIIWATYKQIIFFNGTHIYVPRDPDGRFAIQRRTRVYYKNIASVRLIRSSRNSRGQSTGRPVSITLAFLEITLKNGRKQRILLSRHNKWQWARIIDELKTRLSKINNEVQIPDTKEMIKNLPKSSSVIFDKKHD